MVYYAVVYCAVIYLWVVLAVCSCIALCSRSTPQPTSTQMNTCASSDAGNSLSQSSPTGQSVITNGERRRLVDLLSPNPTSTDANV